MWHEIKTNEQLEAFLWEVGYFHDSCLKELRNVSGAYVTEERSMYPINDSRTLRVIIQRQFDELPVIELEFSGLNYLKLAPNWPYTCEILDATMLMTDQGIYWCDWGGLTEEQILSYSGTVICAEGFRWRALPSGLGDEEIYQMG